MLSVSTYKTYPGEFCLTACICNILKSNGYGVNEEDLVCGKNFLTLECVTDISSISVNIIRAINEMCDNHKIILTKIAEDTTSKLVKEIIDDEQVIILHMNCIDLKYSTLFSNTATRQNMHYVNFLKYNNQQYYVSDAYIPSRPISFFEGWINLDEKMFTNCSAYIVKSTQEIPITEQEVYLSISESIRNSKEQNYKAFNKFIENIYHLGVKYPIQERMIILHDMADEVGISGAKVSRIFLVKLLQKFHICYGEKEICERLWKVIEKYSILRMYLLKAAFGYRVYDIESSISVIKQIRDEEQEIFELILSYINK